MLDDLKRGFHEIPTWGWWLAAAAAIVLFLLHARGSSGAANGPGSPGTTTTPGTGTDAGGGTGGTDLSPVVDALNQEQAANQQSFQALLQAQGQQEADLLAGMQAQSQQQQQAFDQLSQQNQAGQQAFLAALAGLSQTNTGQSTGQGSYTQGGYSVSTDPSGNQHFDFTPFGPAPAGQTVTLGFPQGNVSYPQTATVVDNYDFGAYQTQTRALTTQFSPEQISALNAAYTGWWTPTPVTLPSGGGSSIPTAAHGIVGTGTSVGKRQT